MPFKFKLIEEDLEIKVIITTNKNPLNIDFDISNPDTKPALMAIMERMQKRGWADEEFRTTMEMTHGRKSYRNNDGTYNFEYSMKMISPSKYLN
jgi:hypothetical protein